MISPYNTLQEQQIGKPFAPWRVLVCCLLLNRTNGDQVRPMIDSLFERCPDPGCFAAYTEADREDLAQLIKPLGFANQRSRYIVGMSVQYHTRFRHVDPMQLHEDAHWVRGLVGCGQYAVDSVNIFCYGRLENPSSDTWLQKYVDWRRSVPQ